MDVLEAGIGRQLGSRRRHVWCWSPSERPVEWERRTLVLGGLSPLGLVAAGISAVFSAMGNRRRREEALRDAGPRWRYDASGAGSLVEDRLVVQEESGVERSFDLVDAERVDSPAAGWLRVSREGSDAQWAIQVM